MFSHNIISFDSHNNTEKGKNKHISVVYLFVTQQNILKMCFYVII